MDRKARVEGQVVLFESNVLPAADLRTIDANDPSIVAMNKALRGEPWSIEHQMGSESITLPRPQTPKVERKRNR